MEKVINCNTKHENAGVYRVCARPTTPKKMNPTTLKKSAKNKLRYLCRGARLAGFSMRLNTADMANARISEMECYAQYLDFVEDTERCKRFLRVAIKEQKDNYYFSKS